MRRREVQFKIGDLLLAHLREKMFPRGEYNKLNMKTIGPYKILRKANAYELEFPTNMDISPIFIVAYLYPYRGDTIEAPKEIQDKT